MSWRFGLATVLTGVAAGIAAVLLTLLLHAVQHAAFGYSEDSFLTGVQHASSVRKVFALAAGGALAGGGWWLHRRLVRENISVTHALTERAPRLPLLATATDAALQILAVGSGASLGREGAPRQLGAALGSAIAARLDLTPEQRRMLSAAGVGAGLAAVYNVPLSGAAFTLEILLATLNPRAVIPAIVTAGLADLTAWPVLGLRPTYHLTAPSLTLSVLVAALVLGPLAGLFGVAFRAAMTGARTHAPTGWWATVSVPILFAALGAAAITYPQLLGNGKGLAQLALTGSMSLTLAAVLAVLKPIATTACLGSGAIGGLLTPAFATGATVGLLAGDLWSRLWPGGAPAAYALLGAAALLAVTQRAPFAAVLLTLEFTHVGLALLPALALTVLGARLAQHLTPKWTARLRQPSQRELQQRASHDAPRR